MGSPFMPPNGGATSPRAADMTLRDFFAGLALAGLFQSRHGGGDSARIAWDIADAMIEERRRRAE